MLTASSPRIPENNEMSRLKVLRFVMSSSVKELNGLEPENGDTDVKESKVANPNASRPCKIKLIISNRFV